MDNHGIYGRMTFGKGKQKIILLIEENLLEKTPLVQPDSQLEEKLFQQKRINTGGIKYNLKHSLCFKAKQ